MLNPLIVSGQVYGAYGWGVGAALHEEFVYGEDGSFLSGTFADYLCPTAYEVPEPVILHMETPSLVAPLGAKGIGEGNCMSVPVCIANAVCDAIGVDNVTLPLDAVPEVSALIHGRGAAAARTGRRCRPTRWCQATARRPAAHDVPGSGEIGGAGARREQVWRVTLLDPNEARRRDPRLPQP